MADSFKIFAQSLHRLLMRPEKRDRFMELETTEAVRSELKIPTNMVDELKRILHAMSGVEHEEAPPASNSELEDKAMETVTSAEQFLERSFGQLRMGARILMAMSVTMFLIGVGFLVIAAVRSFTHPESATVTGVIAGVGVVQIVTLFYRNPLRDIGRSISNAQQSKMIIMSYMLGVSLIAKSLKGVSVENEQRSLSTLTQQALEQLEQFAEGQHPPQNLSTPGAENIVGTAE